MNQELQAFNTYVCVQPGCFMPIDQRKYIFYYVWT